eukprot:2676249-Pyramimonas_sp.AAC.1
MGCGPEVRWEQHGPRCSRSGASWAALVATTGFASRFWSGQRAPEDIQTCDVWIFSGRRPWKYDGNNMILT